MAGERPRIEDRAHAIMKAALRDGGATRPATLLDISSRGLMASAVPPPVRGTMIELVVGRHSLVGQVQWAEERHFGVKLRERIDVLAVLGDEAGPTVLKAAQVARGRPSTASRLAFSRHFARGFTYGILISVAVGGASLAAQIVHQSLAPLARVEKVLGHH